MVKTVHEYVHQRTCKDCQKSERDGGVSSLRVTHAEIGSNYNTNLPVLPYISAQLRQNTGVFHTLAGFVVFVRYVPCLWEAE